MQRKKRLVVIVYCQMHGILCREQKKEKEFCQNFDKQSQFIIIIMTESKKFFFFIEYYYKSLKQYLYRSSRSLNFSSNRNSINA